MIALKFTLKPLSSFGTPLVGDTLFGHVCWAIKENSGQDRLKKLLEGYLNSEPFLILSDVFPSGFLPKPQVPGRFLYHRELDPATRKEWKRKTWLPINELNKSSNYWLDKAQSVDWIVEEERAHNSLDRISGTTSNRAENAPFLQKLMHYYNKNGEPVELDLYALFDAEKINLNEVHQIIGEIGSFGYGRDASTGAGHFEILSMDDLTNKGPIYCNNQVSSYLTLANTAPQGLAWDTNKCWYTPHVRFGRHGAKAALQSQPFKNPILLASSGAVLTPLQAPAQPWLGQGVGGNGLLSLSIPDSIHQGYAPVVPIILKEAQA